MQNPILGCIADDFTGGTDLANTLVRQGMRVVQTIGIPTSHCVLPEVDAIVVSLKCRSIEREDAVAQCLSALHRLQALGCTHFLYKYCSTFDSTPKGNIGPVAQALLEELAKSSAAPPENMVALFCPAFPENKRTVYKGQLFVGDVPLHESSMRHHPLTPMTDASLPRLLQAQLGVDVACVYWDTVRQGPQAVRLAIQSLAAKGTRFIVADALVDEDLLTLGTACADMLITGGSGVALGLANEYRKRGLMQCHPHAYTPLDVQGHSAILAGSCSEATREQLRHWLQQGKPAFQLDVPQLAHNPDYLTTLHQWAQQHATQTPLVYASASPDIVAHNQNTLGQATAGILVEEALAAVAQTLHHTGVRRFVVAGGETSSAVVTALQVEALRIGEQIAPGVPWTVSTGDRPLAFALKSGNFGGPNFFAEALALLP